MRLETELVFLPLIETLLDDVKAVVRESDGGNPKEARKAALKHFGDLLTIKRKISGGPSKLNPLREALDRLHGAAPDLIYQLGPAPPPGMGDGRRSVRDATLAGGEDRGARCAQPLRARREQCARENRTKARRCGGVWVNVF